MFDRNKGTFIQICHASVGILMECLPEGGWFAREKTILPMGNCVYMRQRIPT